VVHKGVQCPAAKSATTLSASASSFPAFDVSLDLCIRDAKCAKGFKVKAKILYILVLKTDWRMELEALRLLEKQHQALDEAHLD
jgi:hypothetical protein